MIAGQLHKQFDSFEQSATLPHEIMREFAGIAQTHLTTIENGNKQPNFETIWEDAGALNMRPCEPLEKTEK